MLVNMFGLFLQKPGPIDLFEAFVAGVSSNRYVYFGIAVTLVLQLCFVYAPPLNALFRTHPLDATDWIAPTLVALAGLPLLSLEKRFWRWRGSSGRNGAAAAVRQGAARQT